jgi:hypothetical protein
MRRLLGRPPKGKVPVKQRTTYYPPSTRQPFEPLLLSAASPFPNLRTVITHGRPSEPSSGRPLTGFSQIGPRFASRADFVPPGRARSAETPPTVIGQSGRRPVTRSQTAAQAESCRSGMQRSGRGARRFSW